MHAISEFYHKELSVSSLNSLNGSAAEQARKHTNTAPMRITILNSWLQIVAKTPYPSNPVFDDDSGDWRLRSNFQPKSFGFSHESCSPNRWCNDAAPKIISSLICDI